MLNPFHYIVLVPRTIIINFKTWTPYAYGGTIESVDSVLDIQVRGPESRRSRHLMDFQRPLIDFQEAVPSHLSNEYQ